MMTKGYDQIYQSLIPRLYGYDLAESATRLGLELASGGAVKIKFLGREYLVTQGGVETADGGSANANVRSVLLYYVLSNGAGEPEGSFAPLFRLTGMIEGRNSPGQDIMRMPLIKEFGNSPGKLKAAMEKLGGEYEKGSGSGCHIWIIRPLPKIPVKIVFYERDEEFGPDIQVMFDRTAVSFLEFECLAFFCGCLVDALIKSVNGTG